VPVSPYLFLAIVGLIGLGVFLNGLRFARMTHNPWAGKTMLGQPVQGHDLPVERVRLIGKVQMVFAPLFLLLVAYLVLTGKIGPMEAAL
jgi:hypothetical protein